MPRSLFLVQPHLQRCRVRGVLLAPRKACNVKRRRLQRQAGADLVQNCRESGVQTSLQYTDGS